MMNNETFKTIGAQKFVCYEFVTSFACVYLYPSPNIVRRMRWAGHGTHGGGRGVYRVFVGRPKGKKPLGRLRYRWKDNIKKDLKEIGIGGANWIQVVRDSVLCGSQLFKYPALWSD
jgi:hypothetical protein